MANVGPEKDLQRAKAIRALKKGVKDVGALADMEDAAQRLEKRAAKKLRKVGRSGKRRKTNAFQTPTR